MDPILQLLLGLISSNQGNNQGSPMTYDPTDYQAGGGNSLLASLFGGGPSILRDSSSIPQEFWNLLFGKDPDKTPTDTNTDPTKTDTTKPYQVDPTAPPGYDEKVYDDTLGQSLGNEGGYGGEIINPEYTKIWGDKPYNEYLTEFRGAEEKRYSDWLENLKNNPWTDPYSKAPRFEWGNPIPQYKALWTDPTGIPNPDMYNAFDSATRSIQPYLKGRGQDQQQPQQPANPSGSPYYRTAGRTMNPNAQPQQPQQPAPKKTATPWTNPLLSPAEQQREWNTRPGASPTGGRIMNPQPAPQPRQPVPSGSPYWRTAGRTLNPNPTPVQPQGPNYRTAGRTMNPTPYSPTLDVGGGQNLRSNRPLYGYNKYGPQLTTPNYGTNPQETLDYIRRRLRGY